MLIIVLLCLQYLSESPFESHRLLVTGEGNYICGFDEIMTTALPPKGFAHSVSVGLLLIGYVLLFQLQGYPTGHPTWFPPPKAPEVSSNPPVTQASPIPPTRFRAVRQSNSTEPSRSYDKFQTTCSGMIGLENASSLQAYALPPIKVVLPKLLERRRGADYFAVQTRTSAGHKSALNASSVIGGAYLNPYDGRCNASLEPCDTLREPASVRIPEVDCERPPVNAYRTFAGRYGRTLLALYRNNRIPDDRLEFAPASRLYNDFGVTSPFPMSTTAHDDDETMLLMADSRPWYGLTNKLLSQLGVLSLAARVKRSCLLSSNETKSNSFSNLVDIAATPWPSPLIRFATVPYNSTGDAEDIRNVMFSASKAVSYKHISRRETQLRPHRVLALLDKAFSERKAAKLLSYHEMYLRYPYEQDNNLHTNIGTLLCAVQFVAPIRASAQAVVMRVKEMAHGVSEGANRKFAALHLRLEQSDSVSMRAGRREPSHDDLKGFVGNVIVPQLRLRGIRVLLVSSGKLMQSIWKVLVDAGRSHKILVVNKDTLLNRTVDEPPSAPSEARYNDERSIKVTPLDGAAVDLLIMEKADVVFLTTTSSFSAAVYAKRCGGSVLLGRSITWNQTRQQLGLPGGDEHSPGRFYDSRGSGCSLIGNVFLYDNYGDGSFTRVLEMPCGYQFGMYIKAPPAMVDRPPPSLDVLAFRFHSKSPLYTEPWRNKGMRDL